MQRPVKSRLLLMRCGIGLAALAYAAVAIGNGLDRMVFARPAAARLVPAPFAANALEVLGNAELAADPHAAQVSAERLVAAAPIEPTSTALLGAARAAAGDDAGAGRAYRVAGQLGWRELGTQIYWLRVALAQDDPPVAVQRLDALLRQAPNLLREPGALEPFESGGAMESALLDRLAARPPWLDRYAGETEPIPAAVLARRTEVLIALADRGVVLGCPMVEPTLDQLTARGLRLPADNLRLRHCR